MTSLSAYATRATASFASTVTIAARSSRVERSVVTRVPTDGRAEVVTSGRAVAHALVRRGNADAPAGQAAVERRTRGRRASGGGERTTGTIAGGARLTFH